jgi:hypothetical protein
MYNKTFVYLTIGDCGHPLINKNTLYYSLIRSAFFLFLGLQNIFQNFWVGGGKKMSLKNE